MASELPSLDDPSRSTDPRTMLGLESRPSDSPYVDRVWCSTARGGAMLSLAWSHRMLVFWSYRGTSRLTVRGPATVPSRHEVPAGFASLGIVLAHGTVMAHLPATDLVDEAVESRSPVGRTVTVGGEDLPVPTVDTAESFVERLVRSGWLWRDPLVDDVLAGGTTALGPRTVQRRVRAATGLSATGVARIERARQAALLLGEDRTPTEVVERLGFYDHAHLAHAVGRFVGTTPSGLRTPVTTLSVLYKTDPVVAP